MKSRMAPVVAALLVFASLSSLQENTAVAEPLMATAKADQPSKSSAEARPAIIRGRALLENGLPAAGATVSVLGEVNKGVPPATADKSGWFEVRVAADAPIRLAAVVSRDSRQLVATGSIERLPPADMVTDFDSPLVLRSTCEPEWHAGFALEDLDGVVNAAAVFDDGSGPSLYVGGSFTSAGGVVANRIARWDGQRWSSVGTGVSNWVGSAVYAMAVFDDGTGSALYVGGNFNLAGGVTVGNMARWNGQLWSRVGLVNQSAVNGTVRAMAVFDDGTGPALYIGGYFSSAGGIPANRVARWNGQTWESLGTGDQNGIGSDGTVFALATFDDGTGPALYVGGHMFAQNGAPGSGIARWNGQSWSTVGLAPAEGVGGVVRTLMVFDDGTGPALYAGGSIQFAGGIAANRVARWDGQHWSALGSGSSNGIAGSFSNVYALTVFDDGAGPALYAGGDFTVAGGALANRVARWDGQSWSSLGADADNGVGGITRTFVAFDDGDGSALYVAGEFNSAGGRPVGSIARWRNQAWSALGQGSLNGVDGRIFCMATFDDGSGTALYVGGEFTAVGGVPVNRIARWDGQQWSGLGTGPQNGVGGPAPVGVYALSVFDDGNGPALYVGGWFTTAGGEPANSVARWDGQSWSSLGVGAQNGTPGGGVSAMAVFDDGTGSALYVGGSFYFAGDLPARHIARWSGQQWSILDSGEPFGLNNQVRALLVHDDGTGPALYAGGFFTAAGGIAARCIARWNGQEWSSLGTETQNGVNSAVFALAEFDDGAGPALFVGGMFHSAGGVTAHFVARWNGQSWSSLGQGFWGGDGVYGLRVFDDGTGAALYVGGHFTTISGQPAVSRIARWNGLEWSGLSMGIQHGVNPSNEVRALAAFDDGPGPALYVGGMFTSAGNVPSRNIARWACSAPPPCPGDFDGDGEVDVSDIFAFLAAWFAGDLAADFDGVDGLGVPDIFAFLSAWFAGCP